MMHAKPMFASALVFALLFLIFPDIDLWVMGHLYDPAQGFLLKGNAFFDFLHRNVGVIVLLLLVGGIYFWLPDILGVVPTRLKRWRRPALFVMLALVVGPGLLVNSVFKEQWGRARPSQIQEFGGKAEFTPAWVITDQCEKNCSFVSGHASVGFVLLVFAFISRRPGLWFAIGISAGGLLGFMRMGQGGHFLSDVIFSFYAVYFAAWAVHKWMTRDGQRLLPAGHV